MFQRILVPLDGSERAELALPLAMYLARVCGGELFLGRAIEQSTSAGKPSSSAEASSPWKSGGQEETEALEYLGGKVVQSARTDIQVHPVVVPGAPAPALLEMVRREQVDLVVMCNRGLTGIKRRALGSVAQQVIRQCPVPVLLLRARNMKVHEKVGQPTRVAVGLDGSSFAEAALLPAAFLAAALSSPARGELLLLQVIQMPVEGEKHPFLQRETGENLQQAARRAAEESLRAAHSNLLQHLPDQLDIHLIWETIEDGNPADALLRAAAHGKGLESRRASDLLALTTHGRSGFQRWILGSVTERVLQGSTLPLLIVHSQELAS